MESSKSIYPIQIILKDTSGGKKDIDMTIESGSHGELLIRLKGFGEASSVNGFGTPIAIENLCGVPIVYVYDDIMNPRPKRISLLGASEERRK